MEEDRRTGVFSRNPQMFRRKIKVSKNGFCDQSPKNTGPQISFETKVVGNTNW